MSGAPSTAARMLRVGLSTTTAEPALTGGRLDGMGVYSRALLEHLPQAGAEVVPFSFPSPGAAERLTVGRALPLSFPLATLGNLLLPSSVHMNVSRLAGKDAPPLDLFHATDYRIVRMDCPVVATLHDAVPIAHPEWCKPRLRGLKNWLQIQAARRAQHVITGSHYSIRELVECFGVDERKISVVHHGVRPEWFEAPAPEARDATLARYGLNAGYFLFVGTLQPRKNVGRLLEAYLALPPVLRAARQLVIVGAPGWLSDELVAQIKAAGQRGENVIWLSQLTDDAQLHHLYAGAGAFIFPSLHEGFGLPLVEAFASGVPVATSNATSLPEVAQGAALEFDPLSVPDITAAMTTLARDDALRQRCIAAGRRRALELTWDAAARRTVAVYHQVLSN
ncbi:glycosyltransferase family 4 protein [Duganella violaceipulchra]|uniref:Alpha-1,3-rhamnosyl/mannosyltransferase n=1 Tax=Duganella violaceipulchra TaxID=2849652 RepID=A0AA41L8H0_9BURK|nr:glycosyltransferase family 4 protein [Duganella violaceicalia]MCP2012562.1 alpha-1,3-rhamnosyl/mannosyltransferase [Duganella violaceicalia]